VKTPTLSDYYLGILGERALRLGKLLQYLIDLNVMMVKCGIYKTNG